MGSRTRSSCLPAPGGSLSKDEDRVFSALQEAAARRERQGGDGPLELPVKLKVHDSVFVPLAKWSMLLAGNYRCVQADGMRPIKEAVHSNLEQSRQVYQWVVDLCVKLGASADDMVPFDKYAAAANGLASPSSAARAPRNAIHSPATANAATRKCRNRGTTIGSGFSAMPKASDPARSRPRRARLAQEHSLVCPTNDSSAHGPDRAARASDRQ